MARGKQGWFSEFRGEFGRWREEAGGVPRLAGGETLGPGRGGIHCEGGEHAGRRLKRDACGWWREEEDKYGYR